LEAEKSYFEFKNGKYKLIYNKPYRRSPSGSYSVTLIPDFSLEINEQIKDGIVFDAKFRFRESDGKEANRRGDETNVEELDEKELEEAWRKGDIQLIAKYEDIFKMHTYKDALHLSSAFIVFPGTEKRLFEDKENEAEKADESKRFRGIGYIPLVPGREHKDLKDVLNMLFGEERSEDETN
jgi:predicted component of viral defense system (DUF524 family)